jgi:hypothetical protein
VISIFPWERVGFGLLGTGGVELVCCWIWAWCVNRTSGLLIPSI